MNHKVASYCLLLPGKTLHLSALLAAKRFRDRGNKDGAVRAIRVLQTAELGKVEEIKPQRGTSTVIYTQFALHADTIFKICYI